MSEVSFLGHVISGGGVAINPLKIEAIVNWKRPKNAFEVEVSWVYQVTIEDSLWDFLSWHYH